MQKKKRENKQIFRLIYFYFFFSIRFIPLAENVQMRFGLPKQTRIVSAFICRNKQTNVHVLDRFIVFVLSSCMFYFMRMSFLPPSDTSILVILFIIVSVVGSLCGSLSKNKRKIFCSSTSFALSLSLYFKIHSLFVSTNLFFNVSGDRKKNTMG